MHIYCFFKSIKIKAFWCKFYANLIIAQIMCLFFFIWFRIQKYPVKIFRKACYNKYTTTLDIPWSQFVPRYPAWHLQEKLFNNRTVTINTRIWGAVVSCCIWRFSNYTQKNRFLSEFKINGRPVDMSYRFFYRFSIFLNWNKMLYLTLQKLYTQKRGFCIFKL